MPGIENVGLCMARLDQREEAARAQRTLRMLVALANGDGIPISTAVVVKATNGTVVHTPAMWRRSESPAGVEDDTEMCEVVQPPRGYAG